MFMTGMLCLNRTWKKIAISQYHWCGNFRLLTESSGRLHYNSLSSKLNEVSILL